MPRKRKGQVRNRNGRWYARITLQRDQRPSFELPTCHDERSAGDRAAKLAEMASELRDAGKVDLAPMLLEKGARCAASELVAVRRLVGAAAAGRVVREGACEGMTFKELATKWTGGELARRFPDHVQRKRSASNDAQLAAKYIFPVLDDLAVVQFTLDDAEQVMAALPRELTSASRRHVAQIMHRTLALAVFPVRLRESSPLPRGWLPSVGPRKAKAWLYPDEERRLIGCADVPLSLRVLYGFLAREGMRRGEALALAWADIDLKRGTVSLDENKTNDPRMWVLGADVAATLDAWHELTNPAQPDFAVFVDEAGVPLRGSTARADLLRDHLRTARVDRPQLFERSAQRQPMRIQDLRGTFVTLALAGGRSETWVADRTGHRSSAMINRYRRAARSASELELGWLQSMIEVIPELAAHKGAGKGAVPSPPNQVPSARGSESPTIPLAERAGFEPAVACTTPDFESGTFGLSVTSPPANLARTRGWVKRQGRRLGLRSLCRQAREPAIR